MDKNKLIIGNMKMYMTSKDVKEYLQSLEECSFDQSVILCPSFIYVPYFLGHTFKVGVQNVSATNLGAYTGEISAEQVVSMGISYAIIGHSERRIYYGESDEQIHQKIKRALEYGITPIVCIGETLEEYNERKTISVLKKQLLDCFTGLSLDNIKKIIVAYEPIWAIGTGNVPMNVEIETVITEIKKVLVEVFQSNDTKVLYGGSVSSKNIEELELITNLDGYLIGSASTKVEEMNKMIEVVRN